MRRWIGGDGKVRPEFMWAAMDCPGCFAANKSGRGNWLLGEFTAHVDRRVHIDEPCRVDRLAISLERPQARSRHRAVR